MKDDIKGEVYSTSFHSQNERLKNMNMDGQMILLCEDYSDLTIPTSNHMPDIHLFISVVYGTFEKVPYQMSKLHLFLVTSLALPVLAHSDI